MIDLYYMDLECDCPDGQSQALYGVLPPDRLEKIKRLKNENVAKKKLLSSAMMQYVLSKRLGVPIEQLSYSYGKEGKPEIDYDAMEQMFPEIRQGCFFNLSHSGRYAVMAVSDSEVGIDVEHVRKNRLPVAKRFFCEEEYLDITDKETEREQALCFLEYWTMKEAYIKRSGTGLGTPLDSFCIERDGDCFSHVRGEDIYFATFLLDADYCVSVCSKDLAAIEACGRADMAEVRPEDII